MADPPMEPHANPSNERESRSYSSQPPSPAQSRASNTSQQESDQSAYQTGDLSSTDVVDAIDFARTRTPLSVDQIEPATNYFHPSVEDHEDTKFETYESPPRRISPFAAEFMSVSAGSSVFTKRKDALPEEIAKVSVDTEKLLAAPEEKPAPPEDVPNGGPSEPATCEDNFINQEPAGKPPTDSQADTVTSDANDYLVDVDVPEVGETTDVVTQPGLLTILDEEIDQQLTGNGYVLLEPNSADSSPLKISFPDFSDAPKSPRTLGSSQSSQESVTNSDTIEVDDLPDAAPFDIDQTQSIEKHDESATTEDRVQENDRATIDLQATDDSSIDHEQDKESVQDDPPRMKTSNADSRTARGEEVDEERPRTPTLKTLDASPDCASTGATPDNSIDSPDGSERIVFQPSIPQLVSIQPTVAADSNQVSSNQARSHYQRPYVTDGSPSAESSDAGEGYKPLLVKCHKPDFHLNLKMPELSVALSPSDMYRDKDLSRIVSEVEEDTLSPVVPDSQVMQTHTLINQALQEFKVDFLQHIEAIIQQSTKPARNSAAAMMLPRPSPLQMDKLIGVSIPNAQDELTNRIDSSKAEAIGSTLCMAEATKEHSTALADDLKKTVLEHVDRRLETFEKMLVELQPMSQQDSVQNEAHLKAIVTELLPPETLNTLERLPELIEQVNTLAITNTKEVSTKLEQYAATANTVSNLCTRLDDTITSKQALQNDIISNLFNVLNQSTLQNNTINDLSIVVAPLVTLIKGISYDMSLIDAKLAKNVGILSSVTGQTEKLENAAERFSKVVGEAQRKFVMVMTKMDQIAQVGSVVDGARVVERFEALQCQMVAMQEQMDRIAAAMAKQAPDETGIEDMRTSTQQHTVVVPVTHGVSPSPPLSLIEYTSAPSSPTSDTASPQVTSNDPLEPTFTITTSTKLTNRAVINLPFQTTIPISQATSVPTILTHLRPLWTKQLLSRGVHAAKLQLVAIWVSSADSPYKRVIDNDLAYRGWYKAVTTGAEHGRTTGALLNLEFLDCRSEDEVEEAREARGPMSKKRKQEVLTKENGEAVEFRLDIWGSARQTMFGGGVESGYGVLDRAGRGMGGRMAGRELGGKGGRDGY